MTFGRVRPNAWNSHGGVVDKRRNPSHISQPPGWGRAAEAIVALSVRQHRNITRTQLLELGLAARAIDRSMASGRLHRVYAGVYSVGTPPVSALERAAAAVLACGPHAALSHRSAMTLWGFSKRWSAPFEVVVPGDRRPHGIKVHRSRTLARRDTTKHLGIRVTTPARTFLDCAPELTAKARTRAVNDALLSHYLTKSALAEIVSRFPSSPAAALLRPFVSDPGGPTRSELEDGFLEFCARFGLPRPETNAHVAGYLVDAWFPDERLIVELDSWDFHSSRTTFESDRDRDADTLLAGLATVRVTWRRMQDTAEAEATRLRKILRARREG